MTDHRPGGPGRGLRAGAIQSSREVRRMFDRIVPLYDLMNRVMTGGRDSIWRTMVAKRAAARAATVLDVATGTGDLAFAIRRAGVDTVVGVDFSSEMIAAANRKADDAGDPTVFLVGDALRLPFPDKSFDACTVSFGLRNMADYDAALAEMIRILRPGGTFFCLEMTPFRRPILGPVFRVYFDRLVPLVGGLLSGDLAAYRYLPRSVEAFPAAHELADRMRAAGLEEVEYALLGFGTVAIHSGTRPPTGAPHP
ncbi:MAG: ubiquinone/menaquinone biosynthesis methyltransferase [Chloroflexia bacterium]|nr:ubiquinone/menaquinone biosynthesis methyltransferase [Chloroflexia bacterium]